MFGTVASNAAAASLIGLLTFLIFGLPVGQVVQDGYARAWRVDAGSLSDQWRFAVWFVVSTGLMGLRVSEEALVSSLGLELLLPVWLGVLVGFWLWTPWFLLHGQIALRRLLPGAVLLAVAYTVAMAASEFLVGRWVNENGRLFGSFGVAVALLTWGQVLGGIWLSCTIFPPVYAEWRAGWKRSGSSPFTDRKPASEQ